MPVYNEQCKLKSDYHKHIYPLVLKREYLKQQQVDGMTQQPQNSLDSPVSKVRDLLDPDAALDSLYENQQKRRGDLPFKTPLQSEGFQKLLDLQ